MSRKRNKLLLALALLLVLAAGVAVTGYAFFFQRPVIIPHPQAEYMAAPGTTWLGWYRTTINRHHMRAVEVDSYPVLFIGDSVIHGLYRMHQRDTAVSILTERLGLPVGNASAVTWGPPNQLGYVRAFGLFDAQVVVLVLSSHDASDVPGYDGVDCDHVHPEAIAALSELLDLIVDSGATPIMALFLSSYEIEDGPKSGHHALRAEAESRGVEVVLLQIPSEEFYNWSHPNREGQQRIADQLQPIIDQALRNRPES